MKSLGICKNMPYSTSLKIALLVLYTYNLELCSRQFEKILIIHEYCNPL